MKQDRSLVLTLVIFRFLVFLFQTQLPTNSVVLSNSFPSSLKLDWLNWISIGIFSWETDKFPTSTERIY